MARQVQLYSFLLLLGFVLDGGILRFLLDILALSRDLTFIPSYDTDIVSGARHHLSLTQEMTKRKEH
jgi:hypothetical protein